MPRHTSYTISLLVLIKQRAICALLLYFVFVSVAYAQNSGLPRGPYNKDVPYQQAVPHLVDDVFERAAPIQNKEEIFNEFAVPLTSRLPEFLEDWITAMEDVSQQRFPDLNVARFQELGNKWEEIVFKYPGLQGLEVIMIPVAEQLLEGLPELRPRQGNEPPIANLYELYVALEREDPWGLGGLFIIEPLPAQNCITRMSAHIQEIIRRGVKRTNVLFKRTQKECNGELEFCEVIENNEIIKQARRVGDVTILHTTLEQMRANGEDPSIVSLVEEWVNLIDQNLEVAWLRGELSDYLYYYLYAE